MRYSTEGLFLWFFANRNSHYGFGLEQLSVVSRIVAAEENENTSTYFAF